MKLQKHNGINLFLTFEYWRAINHFSPIGSQQTQRDVSQCSVGGRCSPDEDMGLWQDASWHRRLHILHVLDVPCIILIALCALRLNTFWEPCPGHCVLHVWVSYFRLVWLPRICSEFPTISEWDKQIFSFFWGELLSARSLLVKQKKIYLPGLELQRQLQTLLYSLQQMVVEEHQLCFTL